jgi:hypothetical protein
LNICQDLIGKQVEGIRSKLQIIDVNAIARQTRFTIRACRKLSAENLLLVLLTACAGHIPTLETIAVLATVILGQTYSKQAVWKRLKGKVDMFIAMVITHLFSGFIGKDAMHSTLFPFRRVLLQDSTNVPLPDKFNTCFPGSSNQNSKKIALLKIQLICDLFTARVFNLSISGFTRNDQAASPDILDVAESGDLVIRDLGYFVLKTFRDMIEKGVFFLSRYHLGTKLLDTQTNKPINLAQLVKKHSVIDINVLLGSEYRIPVRLVALPVPESIADERRRKAKINKDGRYIPSQLSLFLMGWNLFVTNVDRKTWNPDDILFVYRLRWRIEIIFKAWKSHLNLRDLNFTSEPLLRVSILTKLLFFALTVDVCACLETATPSNKHVSILRFAKIFSLCAPLIAASILGISPFQFILQLLKHQAFYEKRSDRINLIQRLYPIRC